MKKTELLLIASLCAFAAAPLRAQEWKSIDGKPVKWGDIIEVKLRDIRPTQPCVGFDKIYYKLGRYPHDRKKIFDDYCRHNGQKGVLDFSYDPVHSNLHDPKSFACQLPVGTEPNVLKSVVIAPDGNLYLTNGHHTLNLDWEMPDGGPDLVVYVKVDRDYRDLASMDEFWNQLVSEKNVFLFDENDKPITVKDLPQSLGLVHFRNDPYRSLMYFTHKISWNSPGKITVPDSKTWDDRYPDVPFTEFYWAREVRKTVNLDDYDLDSVEGYVAAIEAVGNAIMKVHSKDVGGSGQGVDEMGQYHTFNVKETTRISRPDTGKLAYMIAYKNKLREQEQQKKVSSQK